MIEPNVIICYYIYSHWIIHHKSQRGFATDHNIEESIVRKIKNTALGKVSYNIPVNTLNKICGARDLKLSDFFVLIES